MKKIDILILGDGITGMITALGIAEAGIKVSLLRTKKLLQFDTRCTALTIRSSMILKNLNIWQKLESKISSIKNVYVLDNKSSEMLNFDSTALSQDCVGYIIENSDLRRSLESMIKKHPMIDCINHIEEYEIESYDTHSIIKSDQEAINCGLVIFCAGYYNQKKQPYFSDYVNKDYKQSAIVCNVSHQKAHEGTAVEHFMTRGPFAILPLKDQNQSAIVWTESKDAATAYLNMPKSTLTFHLKERFGEFLGDLEILNEPAAYPLRAAIAKNYYHNRLVLLADSAHVIHPLAGQGLNQGLKDIAYFLGVITERYNLGLKITEIELEDYQSSRFLDNYLMYLVTNNLNNIFSNNIPVLSNLRKFGLRLLDKSNTLKSLITDYAMGHL